MGERVAHALLAVPGVRAVALGGSRASGLAQAGSDIDLYVFAEGDVPLAARTPVARALADPTAPVEIGNDIWGPGDEWTEASSGLGVDLMYWSCGWIEEQLERVLVRHEASVGYSTAWWHNVRSSLPLAEHGDWYRDLWRQAQQPYPEPLRRAVVARNHPILRGIRSCLADQLQGALAREDAPAVLDRTAALLVSYFDVLFAANRVPHPGEKRLVTWVERTCARVPARLGERLEAARAAAGAPNPATGERHPLLVGLHGLMDDLDEILADEGSLPSGTPPRLQRWA